MILKAVIENGEKHAPWIVFKSQVEECTGIELSDDDFDTIMCRVVCFEEIKLITQMLLDDGEINDLGLADE